MKIFSESPPMRPSEGPSPKAKERISPREVSEKGIRKTSQNKRLAKPHVDPEEIRERVREHVDKMPKKKSLPPQNPMGEVEKIPDEGGPMASVHSPEKLKKILDTGAFQFSTQERSVLEKILKE